jgi:hypothetical protein
MNTIMLFLEFLGATLLLGLMSLAWGVDSRESFRDDHRR